MRLLGRQRRRASPRAAGGAPRRGPEPGASTRRTARSATRRTTRWTRADSTARGASPASMARALGRHHPGRRRRGHRRPLGRAASACRRRAGPRPPPRPGRPWRAPAPGRRRRGAGPAGRRDGRQDQEQGQEPGGRGAGSSGLQGSRHAQPPDRLAGGEVSLLARRGDLVRRPARRSARARARSRTPPPRAAPPRPGRSAPRRSGSRAARPGASSRRSRVDMPSSTSRLRSWRRFHHGSGKWTWTAASDPSGKRRGASSRASPVRTTRFPSLRGGPVPRRSAANFFRCSTATSTRSGWRAPKASA